MAKSAKDFVARIKSDKAFATEISNKLATTSPQQRQAMVRALGYEFTDDELQSALKPSRLSTTGALSDAQLEGVTGGVVYSVQGPEGVNVKFRFLKPGVSVGEDAGYW